MSVIQPIEYQDLSYQAYKRIKDMILDNSLKPGQKLIQEEIAQQLGVSRMPLHKAFQMLENEFLVESIPRRGIFVKTIDIQEIIDAFECREVLEGVAARRTAEKITRKEIDYLKKLFIPFTQIETIDLSEYQKVDQIFHKKMIEISSNQVLSKLEILGNIIYRTYQQGLVRTPEETLPEHLEIIGACEQRNGSRAEELMREHLHKSIVSLEKSKQ